MKCQRQELRAGPQGSGLSANGVATVLTPFCHVRGSVQIPQGENVFLSPSCLSTGLLTSSL